MIKLKYLLVSLLAILAASCENDPYDTGDGSLSKTTTVFGEAEYDVQGRAFKLVSDNGQTLHFTSPYGKENQKLAGTIQRSLLYYSITDKGDVVKPYALLNVLTSDVIDSTAIKNRKTDPIKVEAAWISPNKKYLNLSLNVKTSQPKDDSLRHKLGMMYCSSDDHVVKLRLIHDNNNIPGNYMVSLFYSIRMESIAGRNPQCSHIAMEVMTYEGMKTFNLEL